jgi:hypothetical protein
MRMSENLCASRSRISRRPALKVAIGLAMMALMLPSGASAQAPGTAMAWGLNGWGQLGDGTTVEKHMPVPVSGLADVTAVAGGGWHSLALLSDGTLVAWGRNDDGQLGDGTTISRTTPVLVPSSRSRPNEPSCPPRRTLSPGRQLRAYPHLYWLRTPGALLAGFAWFAAGKARSAGHG